MQICSHRQIIQVADWVEESIGHPGRSLNVRFTKVVVTNMNHFQIISFHKIFTFLWRKDDLSGWVIAQASLSRSEILISEIRVARKGVIGGCSPACQERRNSGWIWMKRSTQLSEDVTCRAVFISLALIF